MEETMRRGAFPRQAKRESGRVFRNPGSLRSVHVPEGLGLAHALSSLTTPPPCGRRCICSPARIDQLTGCTHPWPACDNANHIRKVDVLGLSAHFEFMSVRAQHREVTKKKGSRPEGS